MLKSTDEVFTQQQEESRSSMDVTFFYNKSMNVGKKNKCPFDLIVIFAESRKVEKNSVVFLRNVRSLISPLFRL